MGADEVLTALDLLCAHGVVGRQQFGVDLLDLGHLAGSQPSSELVPKRSAIRDPGITLAGADLVIGARQVGPEVAHQAQPGIDERCGDLGELGIPHLKGVQGRLPFADLVQAVGHSTP